MIEESKWKIEVNGEDPRVWDSLMDGQDLSRYQGYYGVREYSTRAAFFIIDLNEGAFGTDGVPGEYSNPALKVSESLLGQARQAGLPVYHTTNEARGSSRFANVTNRTHSDDFDPVSAFEIRPEVAPEGNERVIYKTRASAFFGTPLAAMLHEDDVRTLIIVGCTTSGCVRAATLDAFQNGFRVMLVEDGVFDRLPVAHASNLFDLHHKYATVVPSSVVEECLDAY